MSTSGLAPASLTEAASAIRERRVSSLDMTLAALDRAEASQTRLNAFIAIDREGAVAAAKAADRALAVGAPVGPLHGVPLAHKDMYDHVGKITGCGSKIQGDRIASANATVIDRLEQAGTFSIGRLNMSEFAMGPMGFNAHHGRANNPIDPARVTGGSSSGSGAAVGGGLVLAALGSDTGGSIRLPAACCGVTGIKPTQGRVSRHGAMPLSFSQDCVGPLAAKVEDAYLMLQIISGADGKDVTCRDVAAPGPLLDDLSTLRIGMGEGMFAEGLSHDVAAMLPDVVAALEPSVASVRPAEITDMGAIAELANVVAMAEAGAIHFDWIAHRPQDYGEQIRARLSQSLAIPSSIYIRALQIRPKMAADFVDTAFADCDILIVPAMPFVPPIAADVDVGGGAGMNTVLADMTRFTRPFSFFGLPVVTIPTGRTSAGLPVAIQIVARPWREDLAVSVARHLETALALGPFRAIDSMRSAA